MSAEAEWEASETRPAFYQMKTVSQVKLKRGFNFTKVRNRGAVK